MSSSLSILISDLWKNRLRLTLKSLLPQPPATTHPPPQNYFWSHMKGMVKIRPFLLWWYGTNFPPIKRCCLFCFLWLYIRRHRFSLQDLCQLSVCLPVCLSFLSVCLPFLSIFLSVFSILSIHLISLSVFSVLLYFLSIFSLHLYSNFCLLNSF